GDGIPQVGGPVLARRKNGGRGMRRFKMPEQCPACGTPVEKDGDEAAYRCPNRDCPAQLSGLVEHYTSRGALDIEGFGEKLAGRLVSLGLIASLSDVAFSVDVTINRERKVTSVYAGELFEVHKAGCDVARRTAMQGVDAPFDVVVTTNSGYPLDQNLYQAVKGMSAAAQVVRQGGAIICAAECSDGIPDHGEYGRLLGMADGPQALLDMICAPGHNRHDQWQVQIQAQIQARASVYLKSDYLTDEQVRAAHLEPVKDVEETVAKALERYGSDSTLCVLPEGPQTIPYVKGRIG
ncbi:MAG: hypothetical protein IIC21_02330, partial [Chloroflexi bacterium]|nr:hypothetical protein [Chloroflexota bacterium]